MEPVGVGGEGGLVIWGGKGVGWGGSTMLKRSVHTYDRKQKHACGEVRDKQRIDCQSTRPSPTPGTPKRHAAELSLVEEYRVRLCGIPIPYRIPTIWHIPKYRTEILNTERYFGIFLKTSLRLLRHKNVPNSGNFWPIWTILGSISLKILSGSRILHQI